MSYYISPSLSDLLRSVWHSLGLPMLLQMALLFHSFSWLSNIPLYRCTTSSLFLCRWTLRLLPCSGNACIHALGCMYPFRSCSSLDTCPGVGLHGHPVALFLGFWGTVLHREKPLFSIVALPICIPTNTVGGFPFLHAPYGIYCL